MAVIETLAISPGVKVNIYDVSYYGRGYLPTITAIVGSSPQGPTDKPYFIGSVNELHMIFGEPRKQDYGLMAAYIALKSGLPVYFRRVPESGGTKAAYTVRDNTSGTVYITFTAKGEGSWGNNLTVRIGSVSDGYSISVLLNGQVVESWDYVNVDPDSRYYIGNISSVFIDISISQIPPSLPAGDLVLSGGSDGSSILSTDVSSAIDDFYDKNIPISLMVVPGFYSDDVVTKVISLAEDRKDIFFILDPPDSTILSDVIDWVHGVGYSRPGLNTFRGAVYYPWLDIIFDDDKIYEVPPSVAVLYAYGQTDKYGVHLAPAGLRRGRLPMVVGVRKNLSLADRELLYHPDNRVNPILSNPYFGAVVWGQRTLQSLPTALDRINVSRFLLYLARAMSEAVMGFVFEPHTPRTWKKVAATLSKLLDQAKKDEAIVAYRVQCDENTNTSQLINNNTLKAVVDIIPTKSAERILIDLYIHAQGTTLEVNNTGG